MPTTVDILKSMGQNAIERLTKSKEILCSLPGFDSCYSEIYGNKIQSIERFLTALEKAGDVDVYFCGCIDRNDYLVVVEALDNEVKEYSSALLMLQQLLSSKEDDGQMADEQMRSAFDIQSKMIEAKSVFYELYNIVQF